MSNLYRTTWKEVGSKSRLLAYVLCFGWRIKKISINRPSGKRFWSRKVNLGKMKYVTLLIFFPQITTNWRIENLDKNGMRYLKDYLGALWSSSVLRMDLKTLRLQHSHTSSSQKQIMYNLISQFFNACFLIIILLFNIRTIKFMFVSAFIAVSTAYQK